jgi:hypothetical protein
MLLAQMKNDFLMLVPVITDCLRDSISALRSLGESEIASFHTSLPDDRYVSLLFKKLVKCMIEADI